MGSVKDLEILEKATEAKPGTGRFTFSDRYSVFDWGEMPDQIDHKGAAIALLGAYFFEKLESEGISTHYRGLVEDGRVKKLSELSRPVHVMEVDLLQVIHPDVAGDTYDYSAYTPEKANFLIPLEVIYRNALPAGSSVFKRLEKGQLTPADLGLTGMPQPDQKLAKPIMDVSTKLEITDRYLSWEAARQIAGLSEDEISSLQQLTGLINDVITQEYVRIGLVNEDGKIEVGFDTMRRLVLVDVLGTLDECRFTLDGFPVSKEIARIHYRKTQWSRDVEAAKQKDRQSWKAICRTQPDKLPADLKKRISQIYCACTNEITGKEWFPDVPSLQVLVKEALTAACG